jgi:AcrR family transcriptional regulator
MSVGRLSDRTAALRRSHILEAAIEVFSEHGFERATTKRIATAAGVAEGTIYNVFASKADILVAVFEGVEDMADQSLPPMPSEFSTDTIAERLAFFLQQATSRLSPKAQVAQRVILTEAMSNAGLRVLVRDRIIAPLVAIAGSMLCTEMEGGAAQSKAARQAIEQLMLTMLFGHIMIQIIDPDRCVVAPAHLLSALDASQSGV